jgi:hypothetical protein
MTAPNKNASRQPPESVGARSAAQFTSSAARSAAASEGEAPRYIANKCAHPGNTGLQGFTQPDENGEIVPVTLAKGKITQDKDEALERRIERFALQPFIRQLLPDHRIKYCLRARQDANKPVSLHKSYEHGATHYGNLQTCGRLWVCPVCAAKISERRKRDLRVCMDKHEATGGSFVLASFTFSHDRYDILGDLVKKMLKGWAFFRKDWTFVNKIMPNYGIIGWVRGVEVTHGDNGFHPHIHIVLFVTKPVDLEALRADLFPLWFRACEKQCLGLPNEKHGVDVQDGQSAGDYVAKGAWGLENEVTKGHIKKSKKGRSPFDLLRDYAYNDDKQAGALFIEYVKGMHGVHQLQASESLYDRYGYKVTPDEQVAVEYEEHSYELGRFTDEQWIAVIYFDRKWNARAIIKELGRKHSWKEVMEFVQSLVTEYRQHQGK